MSYHNYIYLWGKQAGIVFQFSILPPWQKSEFDQESRRDYEYKVYWLDISASVSASFNSGHEPISGESSRHLKVHPCSWKRHHCQARCQPPSREAALLRVSLCIPLPPRPLPRDLGVGERKPPRPPVLPNPTSPAHPNNTLGCALRGQLCD